MNQVLSFTKPITLPATYKPSTVYFLPSVRPGLMDVYMSSIDGTTAIRTFNYNDVLSMLAGYATLNTAGNVIQNALTATSLKTPVTISLTGDVVGSVSFNGSANVSIATTLIPVVNGAINPVNTYNTSGQLIRVDYQNLSYKLLTYNTSGKLIQVRKYLPSNILKNTTTITYNTNGSIANVVTV
jgi:hypothetical protein